MKNIILGVLVSVMLVPAFSQAAAPDAEVATVQETTIEEQKIVLLKQLISLLQLYIKQLIAVRDGLPASSVLGLTASSTLASNSTTTPVISAGVTEVPKRRGGGGGGSSSGSSSPANDSKEKACRLVSSLVMAPGETKLAYYTESSDSPVYAGWAPDTTKELYNYLVGYAENYINTGSQYYNHNPDYRLYYALQHVKVLETRFGSYLENKALCGEEGLLEDDVLVSLSDEILALATRDPRAPYDAVLNFKLSPHNPAASTILVDVSKRTQAPILFFEIEAEGGPVYIDSSVVRIDTPNGVVRDIVRKAELVIDGIGYRENLRQVVGGDASSELLYFDLDNFFLEEYENHEIELMVYLERQRGNYQAPQDIKASVGLGARSQWSVEGYGNLNLSSTTDFIGTLSGESHTLIPEGLFIDRIKTSSELVGEAGSVGRLIIKFDVTAYGDDFYFANNSHNNSRLGVNYIIEGPESLRRATTKMTSTGEKENDNIFRIDEGSTEAVEFEIEFTTSVTGLYRASIDSLFVSSDRSYTENGSDIINLDPAQLRTDFLAIQATPEPEDNTIPVINQLTVSPSVSFESEIVEFIVSASDNQALDRIELYVDDSVVKTCVFENNIYDLVSHSDCSHSNDTFSVGEHRFHAIVYDKEGNSSREPESEWIIFDVNVVESAEAPTEYATVISLADNKGNTYSSSAYNETNSTWPYPRPVLKVGETVTINVDVQNDTSDPVLYQFVGVGFPNVWQEENSVTVTIDEDVFSLESIHLRVFIKNSDTQYRAPYYDDMIQVQYTKEAAEAPTE